MCVWAAVLDGAVDTHRGRCVVGAEMRVNVYSQELTDEVELVQKEADTKVIYSAVRMFLHSSNRLHDRPGDDDRSAVTFWLPKTPARRERLARAFEQMAQLIRGAPRETGLD